MESKIDLRKLEIIEIGPTYKYLIGRDILSSEEKKVLLSGKDRLLAFDKKYSIGDQIYATFHPEVRYNLIAKYKFKRSSILRDLRAELDARIYRENGKAGEKK